MTISYNNKFADLLREYDLPVDLSFEIDIPDYVKEILNSEISITELGITLAIISKGLYKATGKYENQSIIENNENHFHVDWYIELPDNRKAFMLGVKTLCLLAQKFEAQNIRRIRLWYNFQTPELGREWAIVHNLHRGDDEEYFISDRLSFYTRREGEDIPGATAGYDPYNATLIIDI